MWKNQIYLDLPPSITQISFDIFNRCSFRAILFKFEYISYSNISLSTQMSQIFHEPRYNTHHYSPQTPNLNVSRFLFYIFTIYTIFVQQTSRLRIALIDTKNFIHSSSSMTLRTLVLNVIIRSTKYPIQSSTIFSKFPSLSLVLLPQSYNHHQHRNPCPHKRRAFTTSPLFLRDISTKFRVPNWFKCFETRSWILESGWCVLPVVGGNFLSRSRL